MIILSNINFIFNNINIFKKKSTEFKEIHLRTTNSVHAFTPSSLPR